jgi:endonuclease YncB( thermonuclease family)
VTAEQWIYPGSTLERVVDGDTFTARVARTLDFGFHVATAMSSVQRFRLNRSAAAPLATESGKGAAAALAGLLTAGPFLLTSVGPYKYGDEWMAEVVLADGRNVTDVLVAEQWAASWNGRGSQPLPPWPRTI